MEAKFLTFFALTEPPYKTLGFFIPIFFFKTFLIKVILLSSSLSLGIIPVPIDQIGS